ncbi:MAG: hypothetical protein J0I12_23550 [Candidatus Eremiobacteraeota bacterium]|nr:hypothetical protein [Candidatus Eremiobacteraeota bacterium]
MTPLDALSLLLTLPASRLCQMLCLLSRQHDVDTAWACLVWIESERSRQPVLSRRTGEKWRQALLPGRSLEKLLHPNQPFNSLVLDLVTDSVFGVMFTAVGCGPGALALERTLGGWNVDQDHLVFCLTAFLESLPGATASLLLELPGSDFLEVALRKQKSPPEHQRTPLLLQVLLHLYHSGAVSDSMLLDLYRYDNPCVRADWELLLQGLQRFPLAMQSARRPSP